MENVGFRVLHLYPLHSRFLFHFVPDPLPYRFRSVSVPDLFRFRSVSFPSRFVPFPTTCACVDTYLSVSTKTYNIQKHYPPLHLRQVFSNPEDAKSHDSKVKFDDPDVERVRRAHLNDLENVVPFLLLCPLYLCTGPSPWLAGNLIRGFAAARILHTVSYLNEVSRREGGRIGSYQTT